ncbi:biotin/lipoyl-binding protein [Prosthecochloris sp. SCSIO W1101]|uniref:biotin/lipoyl-binding protein n=1 Tax=Prosthecochloris sp. SCSIO W1101 TaxID=2992242 RepID=UPI00223DDD03|nr:biotin/lipoyl-binding protein [Prosthecochloris sp. SCSIO W1101]UZJ41557.1 biotin/lipoyl-binding protein [Prosthecochloris sp. SCSIO W1101]
MNNEPAKRWIMIAGAAVAAVLVIILLLLVLRQPALPESIAFGNGRLEAIEYDIATKHAGKLEHVLVDEGDMVTAGQTLAIMEITELESLLHEAEANLDRAKESKKQAKALVSQRNSERNLASKIFPDRKSCFKPTLSQNRTWTAKRPDCSRQPPHFRLHKRWLRKATPQWQLHEQISKEFKPRSTTAFSRHL